MTTPTLTLADARARHIRRADMVPCKVAFIDCKMPGSERKENYSLVGPGVTQSHDQVVNLTEPHGFSLGVAAMPPGTVNNLHIHFTAEVFMVQRGTWTFRWGSEGRDGEIVGRPGDVVSVPTWIFRGFTNSGDEDGWIFTALGGDDTGGIIWPPSILANAAQYGMFLTQDNMLVDTGAGAPRPAPDALMQPLSAEQIATLPRFTPEQMANRVAKAGDRHWLRHALLDAVLPGHASELAPVIGYGMTEDRSHAAPIANPHGFSIEWLRLQPGNQVGRHRLAEKQVAIVFSGAATFTLNEPGAEIAVEVATGECFSPPPDAWRSIAASGSEPVEMALIIGGDQRKRATWAPEIAAAATAAGFGIDHNGYIAKLSLLPPSTRDAVVGRMTAIAAE